MSKKSSISFLLGGGDSNVNNNIIGGATSCSPSKTECSISILQQPIHSKVTPRSHYNNRISPPLSEHRPILPPPVLKLVINHSGDNHPRTEPSIVDDSMNMAEDNFETRKVLASLANETPLPKDTYYSTFFVTAEIVDLNEPDTEGSSEDSKNKTSSSLDNDTLCGSKVSSGMYIKLPMSNSSMTSTGNKGKKRAENKMATKRNHDYAVCFVFGDISVRKLGKFKLLFKLYEFKDYKIQFKHKILSDVFTVYSQKKFPGSIPSTPLNTFLYKHGARIRQRKSRTEPTNGAAASSSINVSNDDNNDKLSNANDKKRSFSLTATEGFQGHSNHKRPLTNNQYHYISPVPFHSNSPLPSPMTTGSQSSSSNNNTNNTSPPISPVFPYFVGSNAGGSYPSPAAPGISPMSSTFPVINNGFNHHKKTNGNSFPLLQPPHHHHHPHNHHHHHQFAKYPPPGSFAPPSSAPMMSDNNGDRPNNIVTVAYRQHSIPTLNPPPRIRRSIDESSKYPELPSLQTFQHSSSSNLSSPPRRLSFPYNRYPASMPPVSGGLPIMAANSNVRDNKGNGDKDGDNNVKGTPDAGQKIKLPSLSGLNLLY
ncbi:hypothetical protein DASC09_002850 [Saccharomycopsis crataegensis]|uniref:Velvet domain-containing protein n=1 Tax=Saccharomycopsis crataegensis TaxID=43959 RepID=A0AAV5QEW9_9ASCO|nr:hypothetical protein DASC09_002850 [Saccharomycopsis crataegensis]